MSSSKYKGHAASSSTFVPLDLERHTHVNTGSASYHLVRKAQTLRVWASTERGPIQPVQVNGRLAWPVAKIKAPLHVERF
jgi:hypothetical protein